MLFLGGGDGAARTAVDWTATHQAHSVVTALPRAAGARPIGRLAHAPFRAPDAGSLATAAAVAALVTARDGAPAAPAVTAAVLAAASGAPLLAAGSGAFADLVGFSAWSMNLPARPADALLARHIDIAARAWPSMGAALAASRPPAAGGDLLAALLAGDGPALTAAMRARRRAARADGPVRFRRLAKRSAGLRPFAIYLDLLPALAGGGEPARALLRGLDPIDATAYLTMTIAIFI